MSLFEGELGVLDTDRVRIAGQVNGGLRGFDGELGLAEVPTGRAGLGLVVGLAGGVTAVVLGTSGGGRCVCLGGPTQACPPC